MCATLKISRYILALWMLGVPLAGLSMAEEKHYAILFGSQSQPRRPRFSHTFCTFIKAELGDPDRIAEPKFEVHTISWLPTSGQVRVLKLRADPGRNFSLDESLQLARATGQQVRAYGPYEIPAETYNKLLRQKVRLDSRVYAYKAIDVRRTGAINCIHAVTLADPAWGGMGVPDQMYGFPSVQHLAEVVTRRQALSQNQDWVLEKLAIRTGAGVRYMTYDPERRQHLARVTDPTAPILTRAGQTAPEYLR